MATSAISALTLAMCSTCPNKIFLSNSHRDPTPYSINARVSMYESFQQRNKLTHSVARLWTAVAERLYVEKKHKNSFPCTPVGKYTNIHYCATHFSISLLCFTNLFAIFGKLAQFVGATEMQVVHHIFMHHSRKLISLVSLSFFKAL